LKWRKICDKHPDKEIPETDCQDTREEGTYEIIKRGNNGKGNLTDIDRVDRETADFKTRTHTVGRDTWAKNEDCDEIGSLYRITDGGKMISQNKT
jgi:hypothetical protein